MMLTHEHRLTVEKSHTGEIWAWDYVQTWQKLGYRLERREGFGKIQIVAKIKIEVGEIQKPEPPEGFFDDIPCTGNQLSLEDL